MSQSLKINKGAIVNTSPVNQMAEAVGDFIRYWGFRRIHGQLWTYIYLSKNPLSGAELTRLLSVSKALVSPALSELLEFKLIQCEEVDGRTKKYSANTDVFKNIQEILKGREQVLINNAQEKCSQLSQAKNKTEIEIENNRLQNLESMIRVGGFALNFIVNNASADSFTMWDSLANS